MMLTVASSSMKKSSLLYWDSANLRRLWVSSLASRITRPSTWDTPQRCSSLQRLDSISPSPCPGIYSIHGSSASPCPLQSTLARLWVSWTWDWCNGVDTRRYQKKSLTFSTPTACLPSRLQSAWSRQDLMTWHLLTILWRGLPLHIVSWTSSILSLVLCSTVAIACPNQMKWALFWNAWD